MAAFVSASTGAASRSVTVAAGTDRLLVAVALSTADVAPRSATYGGVAMNVAQTDNGWVQIFYMLGPPVGAATLAVTGASVSTVVAAHYTGIGSFHSGQEATGVASASFSPTMGGLIVFGMVAVSTSHTPVASTNERVDSGGDYYADRIVTVSGATTVGVTSATDPDYAGAIFRDSVNASGTPNAPVATATGAAAPVLTAVSVSGSVTAPKAASAGIAAALLPGTNVTGAVMAPIATASGSVSIVVTVSGSVTAPVATVSGSVESIGSDVPHAGVVRSQARGSATPSEPIATYSTPRARGAVTEN